MTITVRIPTPLRKFTNGSDKVEVAGRTVRAVLEGLEKAHPGIKERMAFAATVGKADSEAARAVLAPARAHVRALVPPGTVLALPSAPSIAPLIDTPAEALEDFRVRVMRLTCAAGLAGLPQVSIPAGTVAGCPVGLSFIGWAGGDEALLDLALRLSRYCGLTSPGA